jgi:hypothetical protein
MSAHDTVSVARCIELAKETNFTGPGGASPALAATLEVSSYASVHPLHADIGARLHLELRRAGSYLADIDLCAGTSRSGGVSDVPLLGGSGGACGGDSTGAVSPRRGEHSGEGGLAGGAAAYLGRLVARAVRSNCPDVHRVVIAVRAGPVPTAAATPASLASLGPVPAPPPPPPPQQFGDCYAVAVSAASWKDAVAGMGHAVDLLKAAGRGELELGDDLMRDDMSEDATQDTKTTGDTAATGATGDTGDTQVTQDTLGTWHTQGTEDTKALWTSVDTKGSNESEEEEAGTLDWGDKELGWAISG